MHTRPCRNAGRAPHIEVNMPKARISDPGEYPAGFTYLPNFLSPDEHASLLTMIHTLPFQSFEFQGYTAKRRVVEYGWEYDFSQRKASETQPLPDFLMPLRERVADVCSVSANEFIEAIITEYPPGAPIGWHRDVPNFEIVAGLSLASTCRMRLRPYRSSGGIVSLLLEPSSLYVMRDDARWNFEHSIPAVEELRYSITMRTLRSSSVRRKKPSQLSVDELAR